MINPNIPVLDHGYVKPIDVWGSDEAVIEAARMSTGKGFLGWGGICANCGKTPEEAMETTMAWNNDTPCLGVRQHNLKEVGDEKLLAYLWNNKHATPFEMAGLVIEVQAPIFVFREWHRHRTQSYNEMSARYTPLPDVNYIPSVERLMLNSKTNKQAGVIKGAEELTKQQADMFRYNLQESYAAAEDLYQWALQSGIPKELARVHLPVGRYSKMRASANLRNWLAFLTLRDAPNAQLEIREFAKAVGTLVQLHFPRTYELYLGTK